MPASSHPEPPVQVLDPDSLSAAARAFQASLEAVAGSLEELSAYQVRHLLARHVMEHALQGERDPIRLQEAAVRYLKAVAARPRTVVV